MSGGVSDTKNGKDYCVMTSPRERGCFYHRHLEGERHRDFSRERGCFRRRYVRSVFGAVFPASAGCFQDHVCRGRQRRVSPRERRYFLGMQAVERGQGDSPRERGCFQGEPAQWVQQTNFLARAGVFPSCRTRLVMRYRLPRASGGVSWLIRSGGITVLTSPRKRGCFPDREHDRLPGPDVPA